jgi:tRNA-specific 2-thiouridylase
MCNKEIKFGLFLKKALAEGADFIATGHYARVHESRIMNHESWKLMKAKDKNKDQTYFLWTLTQDQLKHVLFPIGEYTKPEVRKLAKKFGLPNFAKKDSQGVCFVGELDMHDFFERIY